MRASARGGMAGASLEAPSRTPAPRGCAGEGTAGGDGLGNGVSSGAAGSRRETLPRLRPTARRGPSSGVGRRALALRTGFASSASVPWERVVMLGPAGGDAQRPPRTNLGCARGKSRGLLTPAGGLGRDLGGSGWIRVFSRPRTARRGSPRRPAPCATCRGLRTIRPRGRRRPDGGSRCSRPVPESGGPRR